MRIVVITSTDSPRLDYMLRYLKYRLGAESVIAVPAVGSVEADFLIYYGNEKPPADTDLTVPDSGLLKKGAVADKSQVIEDLSRRDFIQKDAVNFRTVVDFLGLSFFLLSRMEEYGRSDLEKDFLGRFTSADSVLADCRLLQIPIIDRWMNRLLELPGETGTSLNLDRPAFDLIPSCDVDTFYAIKGRSLLRSVGSGLAQILRGDLSGVGERLRYHIGRAADPYDKLGLLAGDAERLQNKLRCFILYPAKKTRPQDRSGLDQKFPFKEELKKWGDKICWGLHPSLYSDHSAELILKEKNQLEELVNRPVEISRQHFLNLRLPDTYRALIEAGLKEDHSMGFHDQAGFRAGTSRPFFWYDLEREETTALLVYPLVFMDATVKHHGELGPDESCELVRELLQETYTTNGIFSYLWHNSSLSGFDGWKDYRSVYDFITDKAEELLEK